MKATSFFGGVQILNIIITILRSKFIAVVLGPAGMGISGLLTASAGLIGGLTNFGLGIGAVKDIAFANSTANNCRIAIVVTVLRRLAWATGILGALVMIVFSSWLSQRTFGNHEYTVAFIWLSITLLFTQLTTGQLAILQGLRKLQYLAKASLAGSAFGLLITIPFYYKFGFDGIVPAIIFSSIISLLLSVYFAKKVKINSVKVSSLTMFIEGKNMLSMGFLISLIGLISMGTSYVVTIFINNTGGTTQVGLYAAGFAIINSYVGLIFTAMATDYYPRLCAVAHNNELCKEIINQQAEIALLILAPVLMVFLVFIQWVVIILYSYQFIAVDAMIHWAALGMFFKASSWAIGFILLAKGNSKVFFLSELAANLYVLIFNILGYKFFGLEGLGISFLIGYVLVLVHVFLIAKYKYAFTFHITFLKIFLIQFLLAIACFAAVKFIASPFLYFIGIPIIMLSAWSSYVELDKRLQLKNYILQFIRR